VQRKQFIRFLLMFHLQ